MVTICPRVYERLQAIARRAKLQMEAHEEWEDCICDKTSVHPCSHMIRYRNACDLLEEDARLLVALELSAEPRVEED